VNLLAVLGMAVILIIPISYVNGCCPSSPAGISPDEMIKGLEQEAQQLQGQNSKYLQMIYILIGVIIALSVEIIVIYSKYLRKKNMKEKANPES